MIQPLADEQSIRAAQAQFLGKKGKVSELMKELGKLPAGDRPQVGAAATRSSRADRGPGRRSASASSRTRPSSRTSRAASTSRCRRGRSAAATCTCSRRCGSRRSQIFAELGFVVAEGPQIETDWHTFEALAIPKDHPARDMQDTFYVSEEIVLRTHTSPVQVRTMLTQPPPIRIVAPGHVYRRDDDPTHSPMFTQIEGLAVDEGISFADLKGTLLHFVKRFFRKDLGIRLRPSYFPFVEPGAEVDMQCSFCGGSRLPDLQAAPAGSRSAAPAWSIPTCSRTVGIDAEKYTGFAFGMGLERMAMLRHGVNDIKFYYEGDVRFLEQF